MGMNTDGKPRKLIIQVGSVAQAIILGRIKQQDQELMRLMSQVAGLDKIILPGTNTKIESYQNDSGMTLEVKEKTLKAADARNSVHLKIWGGINTDRIRLDERRLVIPADMPETLYDKHKSMLEPGKTRLGDFIKAPGAESRKVDYIVRTKDEGVSYRFRGDFAGTDWNDFINNLEPQWHHLKRVNRR